MRNILRASMASIRGYLFGQTYLWVIGSPRSGSTYLTRSIGLNADYCFNEPGNIPMYKRGNVDNWEFPKCQYLVFKWCENYAVADRIVERFPNSFFLHSLRDPANNIYSMAFPKPDSWPPRPFEQLGKETDARVAKAMGLWRQYTAGCVAVKDKYPDKYIPVPYTNMPAYFPYIAEKTGLKISNSLEFTNRDLDKTSLTEVQTAVQRNAAVRKLSDRVQAISSAAEEQLNNAKPRA